MRAASKSTDSFWLHAGSWRRLRGRKLDVKNDRPALLFALDLSRIFGAELVIARLDRLSRDAHFLLGLGKAGWISLPLNTQLSKYVRPQKGPGDGAPAIRLKLFHNVGQISGAGLRLLYQNGPAGLSRALPVIVVPR